MKQLPVSTQTITDIRGKQLLYLIIGDDAQKVILNVGTKTYQAVTDLINPKALPNEKPTPPTKTTTR